MGEERNIPDHVENLKRVIANFQRAREVLLARRRGMSDGMMAVVDDRLTVNARTLEALHHALELAEHDLQRATAPSGSAKG